MSKKKKNINNLTKRKDDISHDIELADIPENKNLLSKNR